MLSIVKVRLPAIGFKLADCRVIEDLCWANETELRTSIRAMHRRSFVFIDVFFLSDMLQLVVVSLQKLLLLHNDKTDAYRTFLTAF